MIIQFAEPDKKQLEENGYLHVKNFLSLSQSTKILDELREYASNENKRAYLTDSFYQKHKADNFVFDNPHLENHLLIDFIHSAVAPIADAILNSPVFHMSLIQFNSSDDQHMHGIPWHQDIEPSVGSGNFYNFIFYFQNSDHWLGGLVVVPKSHQMGELPKGGSYEPIEGMETIYPASGDLIILDGCCFHHVTKNMSDEDRISFSVRFISNEICGKEALNIGIYRTGKYHYAKKIDLS